ncbi:MAG: hypothetical protein U0414_29425 [Polyangiaceae bacterium]
MSFSPNRSFVFRSTTLSLSFAAIAASVAIAAPAHAEEYKAPPLAPTVTTMSDSASPTHPRDVGMRTAGQVLVPIGGGAILAGTITSVYFLAQPRCEPAGSARSSSAPVAAGGLLLTAIGIPLWVSGAAEVPGAALRAARVDLHLGAGNVTLTGSFLSFRGRSRGEIERLRRAPEFPRTEPRLNRAPSPRSSVPRRSRG